MAEKQLSEAKALAQEKCSLQWPAGSDTFEVTHLICDILGKLVGDIVLQSEGIFPLIVYLCFN